MGRPRMLEGIWEKGPGLYMDTWASGRHSLEETGRPVFRANELGEMPSHSTADRLNSAALNCVGPFTHGYFSVANITYRTAQSTNG